MTLTISIVSYNTSELTKRCLASIYKQTKGISFEVIVVDNNSHDDTVTMIKKEFPSVKVIANKHNAFIAKATNQALKIAKGNYFLILNSDTYFVDNSLKTMVTYMEKKPNLGACEGLELYEDGKIVPTGSLFSTPLIDFYELSLVGKRMKNKKLIDNYRIARMKRTETFPLDVGCDAFLLTRTDILKKIGGYDEDLSLYYTENDLCLRIKKLGFSITHFADAKVMHRVSASANTLGWKKIDIYYSDMLKYYRKHGYALSGTALFLLLKCEETLLKFRKSLSS